MPLSTFDSIPFLAKARDQVHTSFEDGFQKLETRANKDHERIAKELKKKGEKTKKELEVVWGCGCIQSRKAGVAVLVLQGQARSW